MPAAALSAPRKMLLKPETAARMLRTIKPMRASKPSKMRLGAWPALPLLWQAFLCAARWARVCSVGATDGLNWAVAWALAWAEVSSVFMMSLV
jgi:hypothetical protein